MKINIPKIEHIDKLPNLIGAIHKCAAENGSLYKIDLNADVKNDYLIITCEKSYSNTNYTIGYYAVLYLVSYYNLHELSNAYTTEGISNQWFRITIKNNTEEKEKLIRLLIQ